MRAIVRNTALLALLAVPAHAQVSGVMDRPRPDYAAEGVDVGGLRLKPALDVGATYDDNVYRTPNAVRSDVFVMATPSFSLATDWSRHMLELTGSYTRTQYASLTHESRNDGNVGLDGRLDLAGGTTIAAAGALSVLHEPRYAPDEPGGAAAPTQYALSHIELDANYDPARVGIAESINFERYEYDKTPLIGGGFFNNDDRNHDQYTLAGKVSVAVTGGVSIFLRGSYGAEHFDEIRDRNGLDRDSEAAHADGGLSLQLTRLIDGNIFAGYVHEGYHAPLPDVSGLDYGATLNWYPTDFLSVHLTAQRLYDDTTIDNAAASDDQSAGIGADIELLRDLILQTHFDYTDSEFVGIARRDRFLDAGLDAKWLLNRIMSLEAGYRFTRRTSNAPGADFNDNTVGGGLHLQL